MQRIFRPSSPMSRWSFAMLGVLLVTPATTFAADQTILGSKMSVQNSTGAPEKRKLSFSAKEKESPNTLVGDPLTNGATLSIRMTGGSANGETYPLPIGTSPMTGKPYWSGDAVKGFKYQDSKGENGPIAKAQISAKNGTFQMKLSMSGKYALITTLPPNPGADGCVLFTIGGGDSYSINFASGIAKNKGTKSFQIAKPVDEGTCVRANPNGMPIDHVLVLMQENRSADVYLAQLSTSGQPGYEPEPNTGNPDPTNISNPPILPFHKTNYCEVADLDHSWKGTHQEVNNGAMDGFTAKNTSQSILDPTGSRAMGYYDQTDLPYYFALHTTFATGDRYFSSVQTQTYPNRLFLLAGTSFGYIRNDAANLPYPGTPPLVFPSVFNLLDQAGVTWRIYASQYPFAYGSTLFQYVADRAAARVFPMTQYSADLAAGTLPEVVFIDPDFSKSAKLENDEHPISNVQVGQKFVADTLNQLLATPAMWATSAFFFAYDEHGGFYDHVPPPAAVPPDAINPKWIGSDPHEFFDEYGVRVPAVVISPYAKSNFVSHVVHDHTSILRFIETRFGLPALTARDAAADPMLEFFDFSAPTFPVPPALPAAVVDPVKLAACPG